MFYSTKNLFATREGQVTGRETKQSTTVPILHDDNNADGDHDLHDDDQRITSPKLVLIDALMCTLVFFYVFDNVLCTRK